MTTQELKIKYKCTVPHNGGWCDGTKNGLRMRCPESFRVGDKSRACNLGIQQGFEDMESFAAANERTKK